MDRSDWSGNRLLNCLPTMPRKGFFWVWGILAFVVVQTTILALGAWASLGIILGFHPESLLFFDVFAPLSALFLAGIWLVKWREQDSFWRVSWQVFAPSLGFWLLLHFAITTRFLPEFWRDGFAQISVSHALWLFLGWLGALAGAFFAAKAPKFRLHIVAPLGVLGFSWLAASQIRSDATLENDGTTIRAQKFALRDVDFGVYDADFDDAKPFDDRNTTWLGQAMPAVWNRISRRENREPLCVINGGFFGAISPLIGVHEAPMKSEDGAFYDARKLETDWPAQNATLVWKREDGATKLEILADVRIADLQSFDGALGGVRVLISDGQLADTKPGMGGATLKCNRTSVGWNARTGEFWILSVRDPDGEASSLRDNLAEKRARKSGVQSGGWDVPQVQNFWREKGATDAVLFDGGESGQIAYRGANGRWNWVHSSYHFTRTPLKIAGRPLRITGFALPPQNANGGVLNWFYVKKANF